LQEEGFRAVEGKFGDLFARPEPRDYTWQEAFDDSNTVLT